LYDLISGAVQGSILGPILYAIYVSPVFDLVLMSSFADDNFTLKWNIKKNDLIKDMEQELEMLTKWLRDSGLKVNDDKTEVVLFYRKNCRPISLTLKGTQLVSRSSMNVLGMVFDSRLQWAQQVVNSVTKATKAQCAIKHIRRYFTTRELMGLITSNYYSIVYYNSEIWHGPSLKPQLKQLLLSASEKALSACMFKPDASLSFIRLHEINNRATPNRFMIFKHAILLHKLYNQKQPMTEWTHLNFQHQITVW
jgi:hypothetical protein